MNIYDVFPSNNLRAADLHGRPYTLTMREFVIEQMGREEEEKPVVYFSEAKRGLVLNKTNAMIIAGMYGPETDAWMDQRITIYPTQVRAFGKMQDAIRVKAEIPPSTPAPEPTPPPTDTAPMARPEKAHEDAHGDLVYAALPADNVESDIDFEDIPGAIEQRSNGHMPHWRGPMDAQIWAMENGTCANEYEARNSWKKVVVALGGFTAGNAPEVYRQFYARQKEKLAAQAA